MLNISTVTCHLGQEKILYVSWVDYDPFMKFNFEMYFFDLIERVNQAGVRKLILDCSGRRKDPSEPDFKEIYELFLSGLNSTELERMARIRPVALQSNANFDAYLADITVNLRLRFDLRNFDSAAAAFAWLREEDWQPYRHASRSA